MRDFEHNLAWLGEKKEYKSAERIIYVQETIQVNLVPGKDGSVNRRVSSLPLFLSDLVFNEDIGSFRTPFSHYRGGG